MATNTTETTNTTEKKTRTRRAPKGVKAAAPVAPALPATPVLDGLLAAFLPTLSNAERWAIEGWAGHLRPTLHQIHTANSWAKHCADFPTPHATHVARMLASARMVDLGLSGDSAHDLIEFRVKARLDAILA